LQAYNWPGNIRELQNVIERAVILCDGETLSIDEGSVRGETAGVLQIPAALTEALISTEKTMIEAALEETGGRVVGPSGGGRSRLGSLWLSANRDLVRRFVVLLDIACRSPRLT